MDYYLLSEKEVLEKLNSTSDKGLSKNESIERLEKYGKNEITKKKSFDALKILFDQFKSFLIIILIIAAVISFFMESKVDSIVIILIIILNAGIGFSQEYKANKAIMQLKKMFVPIATVIRDGRTMKVESNKLVPGDILVLSEGDKVMADCRVIETTNLKVNEAALTGESVAQEKESIRVEKILPLADRINMVYFGTTVVYGSGKAVVCETGGNTEIGKISALVQEVKSEKNPFKEKLDKFALKIGIIILLLSLIIVGLLIFTGVGILESLLVAVSLAVSAIPEGLPAVLSLGLAFATRRMLAKNVLVRKLPASETLGRTTVICTDKTGTLTEEKMKVSAIYVNGEDNPHDNKELLFKIGVLCNNAKSEKDENDKKYYIGDPTEIALIEAAENIFLNLKKLYEKEKKVKEFSFSSERKMMSVVRKVDRNFISYVKGAPERIIEKCEFVLINNKKVKLTENKKEKLIRAYENMAKKGLRVLGFSYRKIPGYCDITEDTSENHLVFVGFMGLIDPPRPEVKGAINLCKKAGIKVMMLTGDSKLTAEAVAKEIGLIGRSVDSMELSKISDRDLIRDIDNISVFSRISPQDKLRIINILKQKNEIVAMTGDGVNDSLALKRADIGISMGIRGTDVARDSSELILMDDNFNSIVEGVSEGRRIYENTKKSIKYLLAANFYEVFFILLVVLMFRNPELLPLLPLQILWINLVTDSLPALALSSEESESDVMHKKPTREGILNGIGYFIIGAGVIGLAIILITFFIYMEDIDKARTAVVTTSIFYQMLLVFNSKSNKPAFKSGWNKYLLYAVLISFGVHLIGLYTPLNSLFSFVPLMMSEWFLVIGLGVSGFIAMEGVKYVFERKKTSRR
ncbi:cation-transporting P-type ATPase [Candidatus Pacearchaeota archaeon]|nr:cation-transporting P-type ATPase [Candidatus Pacearchaeota archaeon]